MSNHAILDIGTNSIKFMVYEEHKGRIKVLLDTNNISRLGEGLYKTGRILDSAMDNNISLLGEFIKLSETYQVEDISAVGTMCLRTASNSQTFIQRADEELGLKIAVIPGEEEARLSYLAVLSTIGSTDKDVVVFDTGGGSTEFIFGKGLRFKKKISLNVGAVQPTEKYLSDPPQPDEIRQMLAYIKEELSGELRGQTVQHLIGIGGTVTSMGAVMHKMEKYDASIIQGSSLTIEEVMRQFGLYSTLSVEERKKITGLQPKRADVIFAGCAIVKTILELLEINCLSISDRGLRHGLIFDRFH